jgi:plastocyanin
MHSRTLLGLSLMVTVAAAACGGSKPAPEPQGQEQPKPSGGNQAAAIDPATAASIKGKITFEGTAPANAPIKMNADPYCMTANKTAQTQETYMVGKGGELGNVFVYISDGLGDRTFQAPADPVVIDQQNCRYHPHVLGLMVGQPLQIVNSDGTLHNIHAIPTKNAEFNTGQPIKGMKTDHIFTAAETMVPFKCDVHGWMNAYAGVLPHPYFAITDDGGTFTIKNLPPGTYKLTAWHEKLGTQTADITLAAKDEKENNFTFKAAASGN